MNKKTIPFRIGVSMCLLGENVRFDGQHKRDLYLLNVLGKIFEWIPVCPELEVGMGVPREPVRLTGLIESPDMIGVTSGENWTVRMNDYSKERVAQLEAMNLSGFIFKSDSPSCGMERVKVYSEKGMPAKSGRGLFANAFIKEMPMIPVEEEGRLNDERIRENFIVRVFSYHRLQELLSEWSLSNLVRFHTIHKYLMLAHSPKHYQELGRLVANAKAMKQVQLKKEYSELFMAGLSHRSTVKKHVNVLQHIVGFLKDDVSPEDRQDILSVIEEFHKELVPLIVPVTLIRHYVRKHNIQYIKDQIYLNPHPKELMLRNRV